MFVSEVTYINTFIIILFIFMYLCICVFTQMIIFLQHIFNACGNQCMVLIIFWMWMLCLSAHVSHWPVALSLVMPSVSMRSVELTIMGRVTVGRWPSLWGNQGGKSLHLKPTTCARVWESNSTADPAGVRKMKETEGETGQTRAT